MRTDGCRREHECGYRGDGVQARTTIQMSGYLETREMGLAIWGKLLLGWLAHATDLIGSGLTWARTYIACIRVRMRVLVQVRNYMYILLQNWFLVFIDFLGHYWRFDILPLSSLFILLLKFMRILWKLHVSGKIKIKTNIISRMYFALSYIIVLGSEDH